MSTPTLDRFPSPGSLPDDVRILPRTAEQSRAASRAGASMLSPVSSSAVEYAISQLDPKTGLLRESKLDTITKAVMKIMAGSARYFEPTLCRDGSVYCGNGWTCGESDKLDDLLGDRFTVRNSFGYVNVTIGGDL